MEEKMKLEQVSLIGDQLMQGKELAQKLFDHLASSSSSSSSSLSSNDETNEELIEKILSTYEKALTMLNWKANNVMDSHCCSLANVVSPKSEVLDQEVVKNKDVFKKRKTMPRWTKQVKVCSGTGIDGSLDDGYGWRKYGQKDILGAKFPRGYYRCTHRNLQGCLATKQVQKSDEDPTILEITYRGRHTCIQASNNYHSNKALFQSHPNMALGENKNQKNQPLGETEKTEQPPQEEDLTMIKFASSEPEVKIEDLDTKENIFPSFCFSSPSIGSENEDNNINIFSDTMIENHFMETFSPIFMSSSPTSSETNMFCQLGSNNGIGLSVQTSDSDITEILSAPTSVTNSPMPDFDFLLDFEPDFSANAAELFSS